MSTRSLGQLTLDLIAKVGGFTEPMDKAARNAQKNAKDIENSANKVKKSSLAMKTALAGVATGITASAFSGWIKGSIDTANAALDVATKLGTTTNELSKLRYATAQSAGMANGEFDMALQRMTRRVAEAAKGTGAAAKSIQELGLDAQRLSKQDPAKTFVEIVDALSELDEHSERVRHSFKFFDSGGVKIAAAAASGKGAISDLADEAERLGGVIDHDFAIAATEFNANLGKMSLIGQGLFNEMAARLLPTLNKLSDALGSGGLKTVVDQVVSGTEVLAGLLMTRMVASLLKTGAAALVASKDFVSLTASGVRAQLALAGTEQASRKATYALTSLTVTARAANAALGLVGGPTGLALLAGYGLYSFASSAKQTREDLQSLVPVMDQALEKLSTMGRAAQLAELDKKREELNSAKAELEKSLGNTEREIERRLAFAYKSGLSPDVSGGVAALEAISKASKNVRANVEVDFDAVVRAIEQADDVSERGAKSFIGLIAQVQNMMGPVRTLEQDYKRMEEAINGATSAANISSHVLSSVSELYTKMSGDLQERIALLGVTSEAERFAIQYRLGKHSELSENEAELLKQEYAKLDAKAASLKKQQEVEQAAQRYRSELKNQNKELERAKKALLSQVEALEDQAKALNYTSEQWTLYKLSRDGLDEADLRRAQLALELTNAYEKQKEALELINSLASQEEKSLHRLKERKTLLDEAALATNKYALSSKDYAKAITAISKDLIVEAPTFDGLDASVGGPSGELLRVADAESKLREWHEKQRLIQMQAYEQGLIDKQTYSDRLSEIDEENSKKLASLQKASTTATLATYASMTGQAAELLRELGQEGSIAYKVMFAASKAASMAQAIINTEQAATAALAIDPTGTLSSWTRGLGYMSVGMIGAQTLAGMAHDGIDKVPETGTWLLQKGERVTTAETSAKLDRTLNKVQENTASRVGGGFHFTTDIHVTAGVGVSENDARQQGMQIAESYAMQFKRAMLQEMRPNGVLFNFVKGG